MRTTFRSLSLFAVLATTGCATPAAPPPVSSAPPTTVTRIAPVAVSSPVRNVRPASARLLELHRVSVHTRNADLAATLLDLCAQSPFDVIVESTVDATVSADLANVALVDVLENLVRAQGYGYEVKGRLIHVRGDPQQTRTYRIAAAPTGDPADFWPELQRSLSAFVGGAEPDARSELRDRVVVSESFGLVTVSAGEAVQRDVESFLAEVERATGRGIAGRTQPVWWSPLARRGSEPSAHPSEARSATSERNRRSPPEIWREIALSVEDFHTGFEAHKRGRLDEAIQAYRSALSRDPEFVEAMLNLARVLADQYDLDGARSWIERALALRPDYYDVYKVLGLIAVRRGDVPLVIESLSQAIDLNPNDIGALSNLGAALILDGRLEAATLWLDEALRIDPVHIESTLNLALAHDRASRSGPAAIYYRRFLEMSAGDDPVRGAVRDRLDELAAIALPSVGAAVSAAQPPEIR